MKMDFSTIKSKKILTGNAGFKGSWLTQVLLQKECEIFGFSIDPHKSFLFEVLSLEERSISAGGTFATRKNFVSAFWKPSLTSSFT